MSDLNARMPWPSETPDSIGKLTEALAECDVPQRDYAPDEPSPAGTVILPLGVKFSANNREQANAAHRELVAFAARSLYAHLATLWDDVTFGGVPPQTFVWRIRPEVAEDIIYEYVAPDGTKVDPITDRHPAPLEQIDTGLRIAKFYARFWVESAGQPQEEPA